MAYRILICPTDPQYLPFDPFQHGGTYTSQALAKTHALLQAQELRPYMTAKVIRDGKTTVVAAYVGTVAS